MGIGVYIELGGINTLTSPDSIVDLYATFNQAESQNKSDNIKFGLRQRMKSGKTMNLMVKFLLLKYLIFRYMDSVWKM